MLESDVIVLGAGPAGSTLARLLSDEGLSVLLLERSPGASFKVGESLLPEGIRLCRELGLGPALEARGFLEKHAATFVLCEDGKQDRFAFAGALKGSSAPFAYQVKRAEFDDLLQKHAEEGGARILFGVHVQEVDLDAPGGVRVTSRDGRRFSARYVVDASGPASFLGRALGLREPLPGLNKVALFSHFAGIPRDDGERAGDLIVLWSETGWFWIIPFSDGTASAGVVGDADVIASMGPDDASRFARLSEQSPSHRRYLSTRTQLRPLERRADYSFRSRSLTGERFLLAGDAAGFIDPVFSSGVYLAQKSAFLARDAIAPALRAGRLPDPPARDHFESGLRLGMERFLSLVRQFYGTKFMDNTVRSRTRPHLKQALISLLAGDIYNEENVLVRLGSL